MTSHSEQMNDPQNPDANPPASIKARSAVMGMRNTFAQEVEDFLSGHKTECDQESLHHILACATCFQKTVILMPEPMMLLCRFAMADRLLAIDAKKPEATTGG